MKKSAVVALIVAGICIVAGVSMIAVGIGSDGKTVDPENAIKPVSFEVSDDFENISVNEISGDIILRASDDGKCRVESWESDTEKVSVEVLEGSLLIERKALKKWKPLWDFSDFSERRTVVSLPKAEYKSMMLDTTSGEIRAFGSVEFEEVLLSSTSGDIALNGITADDIGVTSTSGDMSLSEITAEIIDTAATSGDVRISATDCGKLQIDSTSGDIWITAVSAEDSLQLETTSGEIRFESLSAGSAEMSSTSGEIEGSIIGPMVYHTDTTSGSISVPPADESGGECRIETVSGSIRIKQAE